MTDVALPLSHPHSSGSEVMNASEVACLRAAAELIAPIPDDDPADELSILASRLRSLADWIELGPEGVRRVVAPEMAPLTDEGQRPPRSL